MVVPIRDDGFWTVAMVIKITKSPFFLEGESTRPASGLNIRESQGQRVTPNVGLNNWVSSGTIYCNRDNHRKKRVLFCFPGVRRLLGRGEWRENRNAGLKTQCLH